MSAMHTTQQLIESALNDAGEMPEGATIYMDPNVGGFAWTISPVDGPWQSGPIGHDFEAYTDEDGDSWFEGSRNIDAVRSALVAAGYEVAPLHQAC